MKRAFVLSGLGWMFCSFFLLTGANAQFIRTNGFQLPVVGNEVAFLQLDTAKTLLQEDFYQPAKDWLAQTFDVSKFQVDDPKKGQLTTEVHFKIDDQHIQEPLYYTGLVSIDFKDEVIRLNLHQLRYDKGEAKGKSKKQASGHVDVTDQVKEQVRAGTDHLYPHTWDSLQDYGQTLLDNFRQYIAEAATQKL